jgi:ABC-type polysaccharide/polyol phosphate export permease
VVLREMVTGLRRSPYIAYRLALRDIKSTYAKSFFGFFWDLLDPLVLGAVFYFLMRSRVLSPGDISVPYSVYVIYGLLLFQCFADAATTTTGLVRNSAGLLNQLKLPPEALLMSVFFRVGFMSLFRVAVMLLFSLVRAPSPRLGVPLFLAQLIPSSSSRACAGASFSRPSMPSTTTSAAPSAWSSSSLRYASPTLFAFPRTGAWVWLYRLNPIAALLDNLRLLATTGAPGHGPELIAAHLGVFLVIGLDRLVHLPRRDPRARGAVLTMPPIIEVRGVSKRFSRNANAHLSYGLPI